MATLLATVASVFAGTVSVDAAAFPVTQFRVQYGATLTTGTITWYNRNVMIRGALTAHSGCRSVSMRGYDHNEYHKGSRLSATICRDGASTAFEGPVPPHGVSDTRVVVVRIDIWAGDFGAPSPWLAGVRCTPSGCRTE